MYEFCLDLSSLVTFGVNCNSPFCLQMATKFVLLVCQGFVRLFVHFLDVLDSLSSHKKKVSSISGVNLDSHACLSVQMCSSCNQISPQCSKDGLSEV